MMTEQTDLVPKRRFKEFLNSHAWEQRKLGELLEHNIIIEQSDGNHGELYPKSSEFTKKGIPYLSASNINNSDIDYQDIKYLPLERAGKFKKGVAQDGDILLAHNATVGPSVLLKTEYPFVILSTTLTLYRVNKNQMDNHFFLNAIRSSKIQNQLKKSMKQTTRNQVPILAQRNMNIAYPKNLEEQTQIGTFFAELDHLITLHQRKLEKTKALKAAYLFEMFPAEGESEPKRRFTGFTGAWELRRLGDLSDIVRGASPRPIQDPKWFDGKSDVGWLRIADVTEQGGRIHHLEQRISELGQEKTRVLIEPHLLLSIAATVGKPVVNYVKTGVHDGFLIFLNLKSDREFMFQWLEMFRPMWQKYGQPGSQVNLNSDLVKNQVIMLPSDDEQKKIGDFFAHLDHLITLHQRKLEKLQNLKKAYLNEMFV